MVNPAVYEMPGNAARNLGQSLRGITAQDAAHKMGLAQLGLQRSDMENRATLQQANQQMQLGQLEKSNYENEPITIAQAIDEMKGADPKHKEAMKAQIASMENAMPGIFSGAYPRKAIWNAYQGARSAAASSESEQKKLGLEGRKVDIQQQQADTANRLGTERNAIERSKINLGLAGGKDTRSTMRKEIEDISQIKGIPLQDALAEWQASKSEPERIRLYNNEVDALNASLEYEEPEKQKKIQELRILYGIDKISGNQPQPQGNGVVRMVYDPVSGQLVAK